MKTTLFKALDAADLVTCEAGELHLHSVVERNGTRSYDVQQCGAIQVYAFTDDEIEISELGVAHTVNNWDTDEQGQAFRVLGTVQLNLFITRPINEQDVKS